MGIYNEDEDEDEEYTKHNQYSSGSLNGHDYRYNPIYESSPNPNNEPKGHYTGRCGNCGSKNLWDDNHWYGCNNCGKSWSF